MTEEVDLITWIATNGARIQAHGFTEGLELIELHFANGWGVIVSRPTTVQLPVWGFKDILEQRQDMWISTSLDKWLDFPLTDCVEGCEAISQLPDNPKRWEEVAITHSGVRAKGTDGFVLVKTTFNDDGAISVETVTEEDTNGATA